MLYKNKDLITRRMKMDEKTTNNSNKAIIYNDKVKNDFHLIHYCWFGGGGGSRKF
jgi:hypothetical protein